MMATVQYENVGITVSLTKSKSSMMSADFTPISIVLFVDVSKKGALGLINLKKPKQKSAKSILQKGQKPSKSFTTLSRYALLG